MARPRNWEMGLGVVEAMTPPIEAFSVVKGGKLDFEPYRTLCVSLFREALPISPGELKAYPYDDSPVLVRHGDSLLCCCPQKAAEAGRCHRVWAAEILRQAGWRIILDGAELQSVDEHWRPIWKKQCSAG